MIQTHAFCYSGDKNESVKQLLTRQYQFGLVVFDGKNFAFTFEDSSTAPIHINTGDIQKVTLQPSVKGVKKRIFIKLNDSLGTTYVFIPKKTKNAEQVKDATKFSAWKKELKENNVKVVDARIVQRVAMLIGLALVTILVLTQK
jgi:hypothetical protein